MALQFFEGFDNASTQTLLGSKGWTGNASYPFTQTTGRTGQGFTTGSAAQIYYLRRSVTGSPSTLIVGFAMYMASTGSQYRILNFMESTACHVEIAWEEAGRRFYAYNGSNLGYANYSTTFTNRWYYIEVKVYVHDTAGTVEIKQDGVTILSLTNKDTRAGQTGIIDKIEFGWNGSAVARRSMIIDDVYVCDTTGSAPTNTFLGVTRVRTLFPTSDSSVAWTRSTGSNNYALVDETSPNDDTDYVSSSTATQQDIYGMSDLPSTTTVFGTQATVIAKKDDSGARSIKLLTKSGGTTVLSGSSALTTSYTGYRELLVQDPNTAAAWTASNVNAAEFGIECV